jgi:hypothetical protein
MISLVTSVPFLIISLPFLIILSAFATKELHDLLKLMQSIDSKSRSEAASNISKEKDDNLNNESSDSFSNSGVLNLFILNCLMTFFVFSIIGFIFIVYYLAANQNFMMHSFFKWFYADYRRLGLSLVLISDLEYLIGQNKGFLEEFIPKQLMKEHISATINSLQGTTGIIIGSSGHLPIIGINAEYDNWNLNDRCPIPTNMSNLREYYQCASLLKNYNLVITLTQLIYQTIDNELFLTSNWIYLHEVVNKYIRLSQFFSSDILGKMFDDSVENYYTLITEIIGIGIILYFLIFSVIFYIISLVDNYFQGSLQLLRRLPPDSIVSNLPLFHYLFQIKAEDKSSKDSNVFESVIQNSPDSIFYIHLN